MKTTMQQLIERLKRNIEEIPNEQNSFTQGYKAGLSFVIECATNSLDNENIYTEQQIKETLKRMGLDLLVNEFLKKAEPIEFNQNK